MKNGNTYLFILLCLFVCVRVDAIGVRAHIEIGMEAIQKYILDWEKQYPELAELFKDKEVYPAFYAGCSFPDWGYGEINPDCAEASHWNPFITAYVEVLQQKIPELSPAQARKELAFFLGMIVHNISDIPWHFDEPKHRSFLTSAREEGGSSHGESEFATDIFLFAEKEITPPIPLQLFWPFETILSCFQKINKQVVLEQLKAGCTREQGYLASGPLVAMTQFSIMKQKHNWVYQHYQDYYYGGVEHDASAVSAFMKFYFAKIVGDYFIQNSLEYAPYVRKNNDFVPIQSIRDTTIIEEKPENNTGKEPYLTLGVEQNKERKILIQFDTPKNWNKEDLKEAFIWLYLAEIKRIGTGSIRVKVQQINDTWEEGDGLSNEIEGIDGVPSLSTNWNAQINTSDDPLNIRELPFQIGWIKINISDFVNQWLEKPSSNHGICLSLYNPVNMDLLLKFYSSDAFQEDKSPYSGGKRVAYRPIVLLQNKQSMTDYLFKSKGKKIF